MVVGVVIVAESDTRVLLSTAIPERVNNAQQTAIERRLK